MRLLSLLTAVGAAPSNVTLVRVLHPSGTGGTTLCDMAKATPWVKMTRWQKQHNCNFKGTGPNFHKNPANAAAYRPCRLPGGSTWIHFEYMFDAEPCGRSVKHVMLFREPWDRVRSLLLKKREPAATMETWLKSLRKGKIVGHPDKGYSGGSVLDNNYIRFLLGPKTKAVAFGGIATEHLASARELASTFDAFLETRDLGNASDVLQRVLGREMARVVPDNRHKHPEMDTTALEHAFKRQNRLDYELYDYVRGLRDRSVK